MTARSFVSAILALAFALASTARAEITAEQVRNAIDRGVTYLKRVQNANGSWPDHNAGSPGGVTALCTLALLNAGVPVDDEAIQKALTLMRTQRPVHTYVCSLQIMVFCAADPNRDLPLIRRNVRWLENAQNTDEKRKGAWTYSSPANGPTGDPSNSQFALLGLYEAERAGVAVSEKTWRLALDYWHDLQNADGSWAYTKDAPGTGSMTCAGIVSLIIASGELSSGDAEIVDGQVQCCGNQKANDMIENGLRWLERNFSVHSNPGGEGNPNNLLYYLYGVERVGRMTARRFIGQHDWFREGSEMFIRSQDNLSGYWKGQGFGEQNPHVGTSFALLFLSKGRRPVLVAKVKHPPANDWNHHRNDLAHLTSYVEKKWQRDLTWQVVDTSLASVEDLLQSPVLFINGRNAPEFTAEQKKHLRDYVDRGGFLFAEACCGGHEFDVAFRKLMTEVFPESEYRLRLLPPEHPIWRAEEPVDPKYMRPLWGIDIGCRTSVVYCPEDLSCYWELSRPGRGQKMPERIQAEIAAVNAIGANVMAYATNREVKFKTEFFAAAESGAPRDNVDRGKLYVARLQHPGGCNTAPGAGSTLLRLAGDKLALRVSTEVREVAINDQQLFQYHLILAHGRQSFRLTPAERQQLKTYLERGGMLFADSICSSREFTESMQREIAAIFPDTRFERIPVDDPLFSRQFGGEDLTRVTLRQPSRAAGDGPLRANTRETEPYLEGLKLGDRYAVIFSPYDVSCALENHDSLECEGYSRADAARIGINVLLYSLHQ